MKRLYFLMVISGLMGLTVSMLAAVQQNPATAASVTFNKDVLPILQKNCQGCHRPGEVAPMSFLTYKDARPWAKAMKAAVVNRQMPPWFAEPAYGHFANDRTLSDSEIKTLVAWADAGAVEGDCEGQARTNQFSRRMEHQAGHDH